jgi:phospholipid-transporting ATPase
MRAKFVTRVPERSILIELAGEELEFEHLATIEFDSDRKRMSVVVRDTDGRVVIYTKGADTVMAGLYSPDERELLQTVQEEVDSWAEQGLRTLLCGYRVLPEEEWFAFKRRFDAAAIEMEDREAKIKAVGATIETNLVLLGALAIEDELQSHVPETIAFLSEMGIKLWVLTGDKHETAVSIARSTHVITPECRVIELPRGSADECECALREVAEHSPSVLVISPDTLQFLTSERPDFIDGFAASCRSVICYRMSPFLKSCLVAAVQNRTKRICLAIGDGANDVNMLQTADVGVGIIGREGRQAASNSDFAIPRFRHLKRLLAVHGRLSLIRLSGVVRYMFYKNLVFCLPMLWFFTQVNWFPTTLYDGWLLATYNLIWTILPPGQYGFFEQDIKVMSMLTRPVVYLEARSGRYLSLSRFGIDIVNAVYQSILLFWLHIIVPGNWLTNDRGFPDGRISAALSLFISIVIVVDVQTAIRSQHWNVFLVLCVVISVLIFFLINLPYGSFPDLVPQMYYVPQVQFTTISQWVILVLSVVAALAPEAIISFLVGMWFPSQTRKIREEEMLREAARDGRKIRI